MFIDKCGVRLVSVITVYWILYWVFMPTITSGFNIFLNIFIVWNFIEILSLKETQMFNPAWNLQHYHFSVANIPRSSIGVMRGGRRWRCAPRAGAKMRQQTTESAWLCCMVCWYPLPTCQLWRSPLSWFPTHLLLTFQTGNHTDTDIIIIPHLDF